MNTGEDNSKQNAIVADAELAEWEIISMDDLENDLLPDAPTPVDESKNDGNVISCVSSEFSAQAELTGDCSDAKESSDTTTTTTAEVSAGADVLDALPSAGPSEIHSSDSVDKNAGHCQDGTFDLASVQAELPGADEAQDKAEKSEVGSKMRDLLTGAIGLLGKAGELDRAGQLPGALTLYKGGLEKLLASIKLCQNKDQKGLMVGKFTAYLTRAEELKKALAKEGSSACPKEDPASRAVKETESKPKCFVSGSEFKVTDPPALTLKEVAGLQEAKEALLTNILLPLNFPDLHPGLHHHTVLLYGAPGVGKTMLIRAVQAELMSKCTNVYYAHIVDFLPRSGSSRELRELFRQAQAQGPSFVFLDDMESLFCGVEQSHGQIQTMSELLYQMHNTQAKHVLVAVTNTPQSMPASFRKKFIQRVYCPLPNAAERKEILQSQLQGPQLQDLSEADIEELAARTDMFTGADLVCFVRDLLMQSLRNLTHLKKVVAREGGAERWVPCQPTEPGAVEVLNAQCESDQLDLPPITLEEALSVLARNKPTVASEAVDELESLRRDYD